MPRIRPSRGTHVILSRELLPWTAGVIVPAGGGRTIFVLPWLGRTLVGTTDNDYEGALDHIPPCERRRGLPARGAATRSSAPTLGPADLTGAYAGVRPLISTGDPKKSVDISRKAELYETSSGLVTITGGKLTTWRRMAKMAVDRIVEREGREAPCRTHEIPLGQPEDPAELPAVPGVDEASRAHLAARYGHAAHDVLRAGRRGAARWPAGSARSCPTSWPRPPSPPAASRRARSPTCCCAARGSACSTRASCAAPDSEGARAVAARAGAASSAGTTQRVEAELPAWRRGGARRGARARRPGARRPSAGAPRGAGAAVPARRPRRRREPVLMGIVNATPDSFSDRQGDKSLDELVELRPRAGWPRAPSIDRRGRRVRAHRPPAVPVEEEIARVVPLVERLAADGLDGVGGHLARAGGARRAGGRRGDDQRRERPVRPRAWPTPAPRTARALVVTHTRAAPKVKAYPRLRRRGGRRDRAAARARRRSRASAAWARSRSCSTPASTSPRRPAESVERAAPPAPRCARWAGRCCWRCRARTSSGRSPSARRRSALRRHAGRGGRGGGRRGGRSCACTTWAARATTSPCAPRCAGRELAPAAARAGRSAAPGGRVSEAPFTIAQLSDLHCGSPHFVPSLLDRAIVEVNELEPGRGGDLGRPHRATASAASTSWPREYLDRIACERMIVIPGNHDSRNVGYVHFEELFGERRSELHPDGVSIVAVDSTEPDLDHGVIGRGRYDVDRGALRRARGLPAHLRAPPPPAAGAGHGPRAQHRPRRGRHARDASSAPTCTWCCPATSTCPTPGGSRTCSWSTPARSPPRACGARRSPVTTSSRPARSA